MTPTYTPDAASSSFYLSGSTVGDYIAVTTTLPTFTISRSPVSLSPGATTGNTSAITLTPAGGFTGNVTLTAAITSGPGRGAVSAYIQFWIDESSGD